MPSLDLTGLLLRLVAAKIELIVVGGFAAVAQGSSLPTFDIDIVPARREDNIDALLGVLAALLPDTIELELRGHAVRFLGPEALMRLKRGSSREKDKHAIPILEALVRKRHDPGDAS